MPRIPKADKVKLKPGSINIAPAGDRADSTVYATRSGGSAHVDIETRGAEEYTTASAIRHLQETQVPRVDQSFLRRMREEAWENLRRIQRQQEHEFIRRNREHTDRLRNVYGVDMQVERMPSMRSPEDEISLRVAHRGSGSRAQIQLDQRIVQGITEAQDLDALEAYTRRVSDEITRELTRDLSENIARALSTEIRSPARNRVGGAFGMGIASELGHIADMAYGFTRSRYKEKPEEPVALSAVSGYPDGFEADHFVAHLIDDTMKSWEESERMGNCFYKSFTHRVEEGRYIGYHIKCPHSVSRGGVTLGLRKGSDGGWTYDQMECRNRSRKNNARLDAFVKKLIEECNNVAKQNAADGGAVEPRKESSERGGSIFSGWRDVWGA